ncbi:MAG: rhodanese-like domain-containing protein [Opitutales bacterium]
MNKKISAAEAAKLRKRDPNVIFLDVREHSELEICRIGGAVHIPMGEIPECADSLPKEKPIIVICHHGMRSAQVQRYLLARGFEEVINLTGGVHAWAIDVEPEMARY